MGRSRSASSSSSLSSSSSKWRFFNPAYYLKRPKRLVFLFIGFVIASLLFWDRQTLVREHEVQFLYRFFLFPCWVFLLGFYPSL
uniref:Mannosyl-oligosaccharide 1 2-alpha-mannosidase MNS1 n=1 Tax=Rhizophora mucronata TaxID=61149 RepID=A0A2P2LVW8_RHIMU